jgi:prevent-host-death family protein
MPIMLTEDIRSVTELKRNTRQILDHLHASGRPLVLTVNGRADAVMMEAKMFDKLLAAANLARLLAPAEQEAAEGRTRPAREFLKEMKRGRDVPG